MSNSTFQMTNFQPVDGPLVIIEEEKVTFSFSSAYETEVSVELWSELDSGVLYAELLTTTTDGQNKPQLIFTGFPRQNLHYKITVSGEVSSENTVFVSIDW